MSSSNHYATVQALLSRRNLLKHTALAALLAPVIRQRDAHAAAAAPRRVILVYSGNGPMEALGPASGTETSFQIHDWWKPLEPHRAEGIFLSHMAATGTNVVPGESHGLGGAIYGGAGAYYGGNPYCNTGPTIDQLIGKHLENENRQGAIRSVVWGLARGATGEAFSAGSGIDILPELNPQNAWKTMFSRFVPPSEGGAIAAATLLARKKSMLDFVVNDCKSMGDALGTQGRRLLEEHCSALRTMEKSVVETPAVTQDCAKPTDPGTRTWADPENIDAQMDAFVDLMAKTLACELTHVIGFSLSGQAARNQLASSYDVPSSPLADSGDSGPAHHPWTHMPPSPEKTKAFRIFQTFYSAKVAQLVAKLKTTNDVSGKPLIDSTVVVWLSEFGGSPVNQDGHQVGSAPAIVFGNGQGTFRTGRYIRGKCPGLRDEPMAKMQAAGEDMARLLISIMNYMGLPDKTLGKTGVNGPLPELYG